MLPWLIGAAVVGLVAAVASGESEEEKRSRERVEREEHRRVEREEQSRREKAERERAERERQQKISLFKEGFAKDGTARAKDITSSFNNVLSVNFDTQPTFIAQLNKSSFMGILLGEVNKSLISSLPVATYFDAETRKNLEYFFSAYYVQSLNSTKPLEQKLQKIEEMESVLTKLDEKKKVLKILQKKLSKA